MFSLAVSKYTGKFIGIQHLALPVFISHPVRWLEVTLYYHHADEFYL